MTEQEISKLRASGFWKEADYIEQLETNIKATNIQIDYFLSSLKIKSDSLKTTLDKINND